MDIAEKDFNTLYRKFVEYILNKGANIIVRGKETLECTSCVITLTNINNDHLDFTNTQAYQRQDKYEDYRKREIEWYESGCLVAKHAPAPKFWKGISGRDGKIQSNYGYLIFHEKKPYKKIKITSYKNVLDILTKDKFSRQAILHYNLPLHYAINKKDIPCTVCTQILIRNGKLNFFVFQRSSDLYLGLPYDMSWHCYLIKRLVGELKKRNMKIKPGHLTIFIGSAHIYKKDAQSMKNFLIKRKFHAKEK